MEPPNPQKLHSRPPGLFRSRLAPGWGAAGAADASRMPPVATPPPGPAVAAAFAAGLVPPLAALRLTLGATGAAWGSLLPLAAANRGAGGWGAPGTVAVS